MGLASANGNELGFDIHDYIPVEVIATIATEFTGLLNATEASAYLGVKPFLLAKLTRPDLISVFIREKKALPLYHVTELSGFMDRLDNLREEKSVKWVWEDIPAAAKRAKITTEKATALILLHKLPLRCRHSEAAGFRDFHVDPTTLREAITLPEEGAVHPKRAAQLLSLTVSTVALLMRRKLLDRVLVRRTVPVRPVFYVCPSSLEIFAEKYMSRKELARHNAGRDGLPLKDDQLSEFRITISGSIESVYRREVLDLH